MRCTKERVEITLHRVKKLSRRIKVAQPLRTLQKSDPQGPLLSKPEPSSKVPVKRPAGTSNHPVGMVEAGSDSGHEVCHKPAQLQSLPDPTGKAKIRRESHFVKLEPLLFNGLYNNPKNNLWKRLESKALKSGIQFQAPLSFTSVRYLYQISNLLTSLLNLCEMSKERNEINDAVNLFRKTDTFLRNSVRYTRGGVVDSYRKACAIRLRFAKPK